MESIFEAAIRLNDELLVVKHENLDLKAEIRKLKKQLEELKDEN